MKTFLLRLMATSVPLAMIVLLIGCTPKNKDDKRVFANEAQPDYILAFLFDMSGSFADNGNPRAYKLFQTVTERFKHERIGSNDRILISQLSGRSDTPLVWQGKPRELHKEFASPKAFQDLLKRKSHPSGSPVYATIANTLEYLLQIPGVASGKTKVCLIVMTDYEDTDSQQLNTRQQMVGQLREFATRTQGSIGFYWIDQKYRKLLYEDLTRAGLPANRYKIVGEFQSSSELPNFDH